MFVHWNNLSFAVPLSKDRGVDKKKESKASSNPASNLPSRSASTINVAAVAAAAAASGATVLPTPGGKSLETGSTAVANKAALSRKCLLKEISGYARPGELTALMGPSGSGKTTLLNLIAGRFRDGSMSGCVQINSYDPSKTAGLIRNYGAYVMQQDVVYDNLTPTELLTYACKLKGLSVDRVADVLRDLDLEMCKSTPIARISGGQLKRVCIAQDLLDPNVSVLMLDEPTSGLDSYTAIQTISLLRRLAKLTRDTNGTYGGKTIICTIHQPSWDLMCLFDNMILLSEGRMVYFGKLDSAPSYFETIGYPVPEFSNPADHFITITRRVPPKQLAEYYKNSKVYREEFNDENYPFRKALPNRGSSALASASAVGLEESAAADADDVARFKHAQHLGKPGFIRQVAILTDRAFVTTFRNPMMFKAKIAQTLTIALICGLIFFQLTTDQQGVQNRAGALFFLTANSVMSCIAAIIMTFPREKPIFTREHDSGMVKVTPYFFAKWFAELPFQVIMPAVLLSIAYFMMGLQNKASNWFMFLAICELGAEAAASIGYCLSALSSNPEIAQALMPLAMIPQMLLSGLFLNSDDVPPWFIWLQKISVIYYGWNGLMAVEMTGLEFHCDPGQFVNGVCPITSGSQALNYYSNNFEPWECCLYLACLIVGYRILAYVLLYGNVKGFRTSSGVTKVDSIEEEPHSTGLKDEDAAPAYEQEAQSSSDYKKGS
eukprot:ANDGO_01002.mRNA.1 Protein white